MSVLLYWRERLEAQNPLYSLQMRVDKVNVRAMPGMDPKASWPRAVARSALYDDYTIWHREVFLDTYRKMAFWRGPLPRPVEELIFFATLAPFLYVVGKDQQVRTYLIPHTYKYEGEWVSGKKNRYFIRLLDWQYHAAVFELETGTFWSEVAEDADSRVQMIELAKVNYKETLAYNRGVMERTMAGIEADAA